MERAHLLKISLILATLSLILYSATYLGGLSISLRSSASQGFAEGTYIGSIDVSGKNREEAISQIESFIDEWKAAGNITLTYKTFGHDLDLADFHFAADRSVEAADPGVMNDLVVELDERAMEKLQMPAAVRNQLDEGLLLEKLLDTARNLEKTAEIGLETFLPDEEPVIISSTSLEIPEEAGDVRELIDSYPAMEIRPKTQFSFMDFMEAAGQAGNQSGDSLIASAIYKAILPTNFSIIERHIGSVIPDYIEPGFEAKVDSSWKMDFKFYNPNGHAYTILLKVEGNRLEVSVKGVPLLYEYTVAVSGKEEFKPRTITQYSALIGPGQKSVEREGQPGVLVKISRDTFSFDGEQLGRELIAEDFYRPVHRIELLPLRPAVQSADPQGNSDESAYSGIVLPGEAGQAVGTEEEGTDTTGEQVSEPVETTPPQGVEDDGGLWGKPDEEPK